MRHLFVLLLLFSSVAAAGEKPLVIAHRGASGYLPEHTMEAKTLAYAMRADYIEQDVVMTADNELIVFHDLTLNRTTDVARHFPARSRDDGLHYVIDFTLEEIRQLRVTEGVSESSEGIQPIYPERFPPYHASFQIHTLAEEIELVQGLNEITGRNTGIYPELKSPWFHHLHGRDISRATLAVLKDYGYGNCEEQIFLQSFDHHEIVRLHEVLLHEFQLEIPLVQLIADNSWQETYVLESDGSLSDYDYSWMHTETGLETLSELVSGIGPSIDMIVTPDSAPQNLQISALVSMAHEKGLQIHPFTFRKDASRLPGYVSTFDQLLNLFLYDIGVDGIFTDYPDLAREYIDAH